jgi:2-dehydro-3-deoxyphosphooctonate aldolase (KDO 8-P synthase)
MPTAEPLPLAPGVVLGGSEPLAFIAGINVLEDGELALTAARHLQGVCAEHGVPLVFKASFDKANRSSLHSYRGPGLARGLRMLERVRSETGLPLLTDIHAPEQAAEVAEVVDVLQIPAFLCRQTDLLAAAAATGRPLHIKKMQMMGPHDALAVARKCRELGAERVVLCERGTSHGYGNLVVDPLGVELLLQAGATVSVDITHAVQLPGAQGTSTGGRRWGVEPLARCMAALRVHALFFECHPDPAQARCDGPSAIPLQAAEQLVAAAVAVHRAATEISPS